MLETLTLNQCAYIHVNKGDARHCAQKGIVPQLADKDMSCL